MHRSNGHHYSITLAARVSSASGTVRPSTLAVLATQAIDLANNLRQVGELLAFENKVLHGNVAEWQHRLNNRWQENCMNP
jgi:hypothetical protein